MKKTPVLFLICALSGCALWTDFKRPETTLPPNWKSDTQKSDTVQAAEAAWPDADWWKQFRSEHLTGMVEEANQSNFDLLAAIARVKQADAQARINGASLLPTVGADAGASRTRSLSSASTSSTSARISTLYNANLSAAYEIDFWGKNYASAESALALAEASRFDRQTVAITVATSVADNYFAILAAKDRLEVARENLTNAEKFLSSIRNRFKQGVGTALDVAQQESVVATQRASVPPLEQSLQQSLNTQALLLGKMPENINVPDDKLSDIAVPAVVVGIPSELLQRRPDVQNAEAQLMSAHADIIVARTLLFPSIQLTTSGGYESLALSKLFSPDSLLWSVAGSVTQPIFEGGRLFGGLELKKARYDELLQDYRKAVVSAFVDVENALVAVQQTEAEEKAQLYAVETARKAYRLSQRQMEGGIVDITTVLDVQRTLFAAQDVLVQAKLAHLQALVGLYKALGGGWKNEQSQGQMPENKPDPEQKPEPKPEQKI